VRRVSWRLASWRRPATRRGWLVTVAAAGAALAIKLALGLGVAALLLHRLLH
jgi:hypothetical protein